MDTKSLSPRQVCWAQKLSRYHFWIDYCQGKANRATDALSWYPQQSAEEEKTLRAKNVKILHCLQSSLTNVNLSSFSTSVKLSSLHQVLIFGTYVLSQLRQFWDNIQSKLANEDSYKVSIGGMRLRLAELQESDKEARKIRAKGLNQYKKLNGVLYHQGLPFVPKAILTEIINRYHNDLLVEDFGIDKIKDLVGRKYYWPSLQKDIEAYIKGCDICLDSITVKHKPYGDLQSLLVLTYRWKNFLLDFVTGLPISINWKDDGYDSISVIIDQLTKMMYY